MSRAGTPEAPSPTRPRVAPRRRASLAERSLPAAATLSALSVVGLLGAVTGLVALVVWATDARSGGGAAGPVAAAGSLLALSQHGVVRAGPASFSLPPLGLTAVCVLLLSRSVRAVLRGRTRLAVDPVRETAAAVLVVGVVWCGAVTAVVAVTVPDVGLVQVAAGSLVVGAGSALLAGLQEHRTLPVRVLGEERAATLAAAGRAVRVLLAAGALVTVGLVATHLGQVRHVQDSLGTGLVGGTALTVLQVLYLPVLAIWALAALTGSGFSLGTGTHVGPGSVVLGQLPAVPLLAVLPSSTVPSAWLALVVPVAAGVVAARALVRAGFFRPVHLAMTAGWTVLLTALLCLAAEGALGPGRLAGVGPTALRTGLLAGLLVGAGCGAGVLTARAWAGRASARFEEQGSDEVVDDAEPVSSHLLVVELDDAEPADAESADTRPADVERAGTGPARPAAADPVEAPVVTPVEAEPSRKQGDAA